MRLPIADPDRRVDEPVLRPQPGFEPGQIDERLERRAGLALRLCRAVELALAVVAATYHRADRAVGRHRDKRAFADRVPRAVACQGVGDRGLCRSLHPGIERGADDKVAIGGAGKIADLIGHPIGEIARAGSRLGERVRGRALLLGGGCLGAVDKAGLDHVVEHLGRAPGGLVPVARRAEPGRRLQQPGDDSAFEQAQLLRRFRKITVRRGIDPIGAGAEIDPVQVDLQDLVLGKAVLEP